MPESSSTVNQSDTPSGFFHSAFLEIESYFELPPGDIKPSPSRLPTAPNSPTLNGSLRQSPGIWNNLRDSPGFSFSLDGQDASNPPSGIAPLQTTLEPTMFLGNPSPPHSSEGSPSKYSHQPGDISPLDSLICSGPVESSRTIHGQVTPPEDTISPRMRPINPALVLPLEITPPEGSPITSPQMSNPNHRGMSLSSEAGTTASGQKRRSSSAQSNARKQRKSVSDNDPPEVQEAKRKRFLERNRVAASKCRQKKKAWMQDLEQEAREAQAMSKQLKACVSMFKEEILQLKSELLKHNTCDCTPIRQYLSNEALRLAEGGATVSRRPSIAQSPIMAAPELSFSVAEDTKLDPPLSTGEFDLQFVATS
ncbi:hypothetical protein EX30DRAFT_246903 [Ascodesmis nigricans]|uniref:BZIP domain-containing protein n=1 Tax=Ascodesmis nigricans TaxID=341454 RepID=A0A4S2MPN3_9PEZI|nr:hypothetical protein EX30DRAFT_246903 [Ascodesmis nigricans]